MISQSIYERIHLLVKKGENVRSDLITPVCMLILSVLSIFFIYSAQSYSHGTHWVKQIIWILLGFMLYGLVALVNYKVYLQYGHYLYALAILLLLLLWSPLGVKVYGALRWLNFKFFMLQPSDTAKIGTLILASGVLARTKITRFRHSLKVLLKVAIIFLLPMLLVFLQPDLGSCLIFPPMLFALLFLSNLSKKFFITIFTIFTLLLIIIGWDIYNYAEHIKQNKKTSFQDISFLPLKDYQRKRILTFFAPEIIDPRGIGDNWNLRQSLIAIGSGSLFGKGHNNGTQAKLGYLPQSVAPNDFIFSVLAEEKGFFGGFFVIILYAMIIGNGLRIAFLSKDRFGMYLAVGITVIFMVHIFINIGMTIGLMPITGLPLPFLSYGGSFIISSCILQGLIQSIYRFRKKF